MINQGNILIVVQNDLMGGAEQLLKLLANEYAAGGTKVTVIIMRSPMERNWDELIEKVDLKYLNTKTYFPGIIKLAFFLVSYTRKRDFDLILSSNININAVLGLLKKLRFLKTKKLVIRETTSVFLRIKGFKRYIHTIKYIFGYSSADLIICQTDLMKQQFLDHLPASRNWKFKTIQNPIDINKVFQLSSNEAIGFSFEKDRKYIVSAGRFIHEKGFDLLIESFALMAAQFPDLDLLILGEGKQRTEYEAQIKSLNLEKRVFLPGFVKNPIPFFKNAALCVVSSRFEGFPNVLLQMASVNDKIVSTLCAGNIDSIPSIITCQANDLDALQAAITKGLQKEVMQAEVDSKMAFLHSIGVSNYVQTINTDLHV